MSPRRGGAAGRGRRKRRGAGTRAGLAKRGAGVLSVAALAVAAGVGIRTFTDGAGTVEQTRTLPAPETRVRVEVLNGGGVSGAARQATDFARELGYDVVFFGNAGSFDWIESVVVDRVGRPDLARSVATALGIDSVRSEPDPNLYVDVSVVLGSQWRLPELAEAEPGTP